MNFVNIFVSFLVACSLNLFLDHISEFLFFVTFIYDFVFEILFTLLIILRHVTITSLRPSSPDFEAMLVFNVLFLSDDM
jgi:hypothetical protein